MTHIQRTENREALWVLPFRNCHPREVLPEDSAKYSPPTSKVLFEISCVCVSAAQSGALPGREANLTSTQAPMQTDTIKKLFSSGGAAQTETQKYFFV